MMPTWAEPYLGFPMRKQEEIDQACSLYALLSVVQFWEDRTNYDSGRESYYVWELLGDTPALRRRRAEQVMSEHQAGLLTADREDIARDLNLQTQRIQIDDARELLNTWPEHHEHRVPLIADITNVVFKDPVGIFGDERVEPGDGTAHSVVLVAGRKNPLKFLIADPHPWRPRFAIWTGAKLIRDVMRYNNQSQLFAFWPQEV